VFDSDPYVTTLDLSKPLPPRWAFVQSEERAPVAASALVVLLLLVQLGRVVAVDTAGGKAGERWLRTSPTSRWAIVRALDRRLTPAVAIVATAVLFVWPLTTAGGASVIDALLLAGGVLALLALYLRVRGAAAARRGSSVRHVTWTPAVAFSAVATALGFAWAPLPVAERPDRASPVHRLGPIALGVAGVLLLVLGRWTGVPMTRSLGAAAVVMTSSAMIPVEPYDGAFVRSRAAGLLAAGALLALGILLFLGVL
jgi:hypothetical protein